jgi:chaperonin GroEL
VATKKILYRETARKALEKGMDKLSEAVSITLGPKGRNVVLNKKFGTPRIVNDGVTIAKEINLENAMENSGVCLLRQAASKTNDVAGDGTTTATVLAHNMIKMGMRSVASGANPIALKRGIEKATRFVVSKIVEYSSRIDNSDQLEKVATISAGNDEQVGKLIAQALDKVGKEGLISLEESMLTGTDLSVTEGMSFDKGFISGYFVTNQDRMETVLENAYVLITDKKICLVKQDLLPTLELVTRKSKPLLIISDNVQKEALATLIINKIRGILNVVAVRAPGFGDRRKDLLSDLAVLTGGQVISSDTGYSLQTVNMTFLGQARKVIVKKESTSIISDANRRQVTARCEQLRRKLETTDSTYEKDKLHERLSKLSGGVALIRVGAATETELKDRKLRLEDAINATKAAVEEGVVAGGGSTLVNISEELKLWIKNNLTSYSNGIKFSSDESIGASIVAQALIAPLGRIAYNAGDNSALAIDRVGGILTTLLEMGYDKAFAQSFAKNYGYHASVEDMDMPSTLARYVSAVDLIEKELNDPCVNTYCVENYLKEFLPASRSLPDERLSNITRVNKNVPEAKLVDMYRHGIIDPAKVTRSTIQNAASIASMVLTTECLIVEWSQKS